MKKMLSATVQTIATVARSAGERYQPSSAAVRVSSSLAMPWTRPCSSSTGRGSVTRVTATDTTASRAKAMIAAQNASARSEPKSSTPPL